MPKTPKPRPAGTEWTIEEALDGAIQEVAEGVAWFKGKPPNLKLKVGYKNGPVTGEDYMLAGQLLAVYVGMATRLSTELRAMRDPKKSGSGAKPKDMAALIASELNGDDNLRAEVLARLAAPGAGN